MKLTNAFTVDQCQKKRSYSLIHKINPLEISPEIRDAIAHLLWYVPNISSLQSSSNVLISNPEYNEYTFIEIMESMQLSDEDILITEAIDENLVHSYREAICTDSQKIIMTIGDEETLSTALLRHIRNAIAHGYFNIVEGLLIGFDYRVVDGAEEECTAIFKIDPENLLRALRRLSKELTSAKLVAKALQNCGYQVSPYQEQYQKSNRFDLFAKKGEGKYAIEIKNYVYVDIIPEGYVHELIELFEGSLQKVKPVLIINTSYLSEASKEELLRHDIIILDVKNVKKMMNGRDMIAEIEEAHGKNLS